MENNGSKHKLVDLMGITMAKIREMVDVNTIVGKPIVTADSSTIIPVSKVAFGFGSGGSDHGKDVQNFGGGSGAGVSIDPVAFLIVSLDGVKLLPVKPPAGSTVDRIVEMAPDIIEKINSFFGKKKGGQEE